MRFALSLSLSLVLAGAAHAQMPKDLPKPRAGLWEMKSAIAEMGGMGPIVHVCMDENTADLLARNDGADNCNHKSYRREGARIVFDAVCRVEASTATIRGSFSGDFQSSYQGEVRSTYQPPWQGMASTTIRQEARWLGPCRAGQKPGDVVMQGMSGMGGIDIQEMMKNLPRR